jgi:hypothetical protein
LKEVKNEPLTDSRARIHALALAAAAPVGQAHGQPIPVLTQAQLSHMLPSQIPTVYRDAEPPYQVHETDGLSRNPNDCVKWGCIDNNR